MKNNLFGLSRRLSPGSVRKMMPMMLNFGSYLPMVMKAAVALKNMERVPELGWNPNAPHPFYEKEEKQDILERLEWLCKEVMVDPEALINKMPEAIGRQYQGQWAYYAISMTVASLSNIAFIYPEMREENLKKMPVLIDIALTPTIKLYDTMKWREDAIESLDGRKSHMTYLSILAWMIGHYKLTGGDGRYDALYHKICDALCRRMMASRDMNLPSFPNKIVFFPDMMFTPLAFTIYSRLYDGKYSDVVERWSELTRTKWLDPRTGLLISRYYASGKRQPPCGSYAGLNCTCLASINEPFGREQYILTKKVLCRTDETGRYGAVREYLDKSPKLAFDIDAGVIMNGMSPSGTSFIMGAATYLGDWDFRRKLLNTADKAGGTVKRKGSRHYKLAEFMLTGEAITLAMRTTVKRW